MVGDYKIETFKEGAHQLQPIRFFKGDSREFILEFDWDRDCITPDWSLTAWGHAGKVIVQHSNGLVTDSMPTLSIGGSYDDGKKE